MRRDAGGALVARGYAATLVGYGLVLWHLRGCAETGLGWPLRKTVLVETNKPIRKTSQISAAISAAVKLDSEDPDAHCSLQSRSARIGYTSHLACLML